MMHKEFVQSRTGRMKIPKKSRTRFFSNRQLTVRMLLNVRLILKENLNIRKMSAKVPASILKDEPELEKFEFPLIHSKEITKSHLIVRERVTSSEMWSPLLQKAGGQMSLPVLNPRIHVPTPTPTSQLLQGPASVSKHSP